LYDQYVSFRRRVGLGEAADVVEAEVGEEEGDSRVEEMEATSSILLLEATEDQEGASDCAALDVVVVVVLRIRKHHSSASQQALNGGRRERCLRADACGGNGGSSRECRNGH
jgi:hypothetical protein